jgi:hypothetical protein
VALDNGEDIIEIVRHTAGKLADRLHFLRLAQLGFEILALRDVGGVTMDNAT